MGGGLQRFDPGLLFGKVGRQNEERPARPARRLRHQLDHEYVRHVTLGRVQHLPETKKTGKTR